MLKGSRQDEWWHKIYDAGDGMDGDGCGWDTCCGAGKVEEVG